MKKRTILIVAVVTIAAASIFALIATGHFGHGKTFTIPACDSLPTYAAAQEAFAKNQETVQKLRELGPGVEVLVSKQCGDADRGIVTIRFATDAEKNGITAITNGPTFGVPLQLERVR